MAKKMTLWESIKYRISNPQEPPDDTYVSNNEYSLLNINLGGMFFYIIIIILILFSDNTFDKFMRFMYLILDK